MCVSKKEYRGITTFFIVEGLVFVRGIGGIFKDSKLLKC